MIAEFATLQYDQAIKEGFESLGHEVEKIKVHDYISRIRLYKRIQGRLMLGPSFIRLWSDVIRKSRLYKPDLIYFRIPIYFPAFIIKRLKKISRAIIIQYMNDDPYGDKKNAHFYKYYYKSIIHYDKIFAFRELNIPEYFEYGAKSVEVLLPYYVDKYHKREFEDLSEFENDALFVGHGENDFRLDCFDAILKDGLDLKLAGSGFEPYSKNRLFNELLPTHYLKPEEYYNAIKNSICSLCFFSSLNRDIITTRVFEITAMGGLLVCQRSTLVESIFEEGKEAFFFSTPEELVQIINYLKTNIVIRNTIAKASQNKVLESKNESIDRCKQILLAVNQIMQKINKSNSNNITC